MEVPGRDVTADPLGPEATDPAAVDREETARAADRDGGDESVTDKLKEAAEKAKDAITPDRDDDAAPRP
jgi:hypothetical protein